MTGRPDDGVHPMPGRTGARGVLDSRSARCHTAPVMTGVSGVEPAGGPRTLAAGPATEEGRLRFYGSLALAVALDAAFLAGWLAVIVAIHAEYEWAQDRVPAATTFMEVVEWLLLVVTALTLLGWVFLDAWRFLRKAWATR